MAGPIENEFQRYGSARFADGSEIARAGMFKKTDDAAFLGFVEGRPIYYSGPGGLVTAAGARSGKLTTVLAYNLCHGGFGGVLVCLDPKGEAAAIASLRLQVAIYWNPRRLHGLPYHRINLVDYIRKGSPSLRSDVQEFCKNFIPKSGSANGSFFEDRARQFLEGIILTIVHLDGVLTFKRLYQIIMTLPGGGDKWLEFAFEMSELNVEIVESIEEEIAAARGNDSGGFRGILGELFRAIAPLSDDVLLDSLSPPFDFSLADLCQSGACHLYLMPPPSALGLWGGILKSFFVAAKIYKERSPSAPRQTWIMDEVALLGAFPMVTEMFTYGAGIGIRPWAIYQTAEQMKATGPSADTIIPSSAAIRQYFAVRDDVSAQRLSRQLGPQSLEYDDVPQQARARLAREDAVRAILAGDDPIQAAMALSHHDEMASHRSQQQRWLRTPDEVIGTPGDRQYIFADGLSHPIYAERAPYFEQRSMAGRFHPNPYHPPADKVRIKTRFGHAWRSVIRERVPSQYAHLPQYEDGWWSYIEGFRP